MFGFGKKKVEYSFTREDAETLLQGLQGVKELDKYKKDNVSLMAEVAALKVTNEDLKNEIEMLENDKTGLQGTLSEREDRIKELEADTSKKVTGASALKSMTKTQLKQMRTALEAAPQNAQGFGGSVSVYDKKTKRLSVIPLTSKEQALEIVKKAEQGRVNIVF